MECIQCFGSNLNDKEYRKKMFYRGVAGSLIFQQIVTEFNLPTSTSTSRNVCLNFIRDNGIVLSLRHSDDSHNVKFFDCKLFSAHDEEKEMLFFGGDTVMRIKGILQQLNGQWVPYDKYLEPINALFRMMSNQ